MKCILDKLPTCNQNEVIWIDSTVGHVNVNRLIRAINGLDARNWRGKRVAIGSLPVLEYVSTLAFLDGLAQLIVLLPSEDDQATRQARLAQEKIEVVIEGSGLGFKDFLDSPDTINSVNDSIVIEPRSVADPTIWLLPTSGTTGTPKLIPHTFSSLTRSMTRRNVADSYIWGSLYSLRRFAGLQVLLQSWMSSTPLILNEDVEEMNLVLARLITLNCNALSATPSMWRKLAMHPLFPQLALKQITLGGEIVDQSVLDMLSSFFPSARITHIYASTEAGVGFAVKDGLAGFPIDYLHQPPLGVALRIDDKGNLWIGKDSNKSLGNTDEDSWFNSGDVVEINGDRIKFLGRANGSINVGGNKVMPEEIESVIKELPEVAFVEVRAKNSVILGSLVEAAVSLNDGYVLNSDFKKKLIAFCRGRLDAFKVPAFIVPLDEIRLNASGKQSRKNDK